MTSRPEIVLYSGLTDVDRLEYLAVHGLDSDAIPTETLRPMVDWAIKYFFESGCTQAPSREALLLEWGDDLEKEDVVLEDPDDEIETMPWALEYLKSTFLHLEWQRWIRTAAEEMAGAFTGDRIQVLSDHTNQLSTLLSKVRSTANEAVGASALEDARRRYDQRVRDGGQPRGLMLGMDLVDTHTHGIHEGELAVMAAGPKVGKSWMLANTVMTEWANGRRGMLFTLENSVDMTIDRTVCLRAQVAYRSWQRGTCTPEELERVDESRRYLAELELGDMIVTMPPPGHRTAVAMVREAQLRGAESLAIDQLTFIEPTKTGRKQGWEIIGDIMHELKAEISSGSIKMPCLLAHQINREGVKAADKTGYLEMYMLAGSSEVERTADWVFGLYRGDEDEVGGLATLQVLASRREDTKAWMLAYDPSQGVIQALREVSLRRE